MSALILKLWSALLWLAQPGLRAKLARRARLEPGYGVAVTERFGRYAMPADHGFVWVHAVSLGETRTAALLIAQLHQALPGCRLLLTHGTATGREEGQRLLQPGDVQVWQPWDTQGAVRRFLAHFQPRIGLLMETEVWPNLVAACRARRLPLVLVNARLSEKSLLQAQRLAALSGPAYRNLSAVYAQTEADAQRLRALGAPVQGVFGNLKFDATPDAAQLLQGRGWRALQQRPVLMFASSREGEEAQLLAQLAVHRAQPEGRPVQWLIVPRHPQRFDEVASLCRQAGWSVSRRSEWQATPEPADIWLGDSMGEMALYYGLADVALLGGSFEPLGGQNLIEAAACGCPVIAGPNTFNFAEAMELAQSAGAAWAVANMATAVRRAMALAHDAQRQSQAVLDCENFAAAHRGALGRTTRTVQALLEQQ
jgi:3-deoxy-D-manno-octulosonic-acid transferase